MTQSPNDILDVLRRLQALDDEIRDICIARETRLERLARLRKVLELMNKELDDKRTKLVEAEKWERTKASELETEKDKLTKAKSKLSGVTRSREYLAVNKELETVRETIHKKEKEVDDLTTAVSDFRAAIGIEEAKHADLMKEAAVEARSNEEQLAAMDAKIAAVDARRKVISKDVERPILDRYARIAKARDGRAVVKIKDGSCGGCNMLLQPRYVEMVLRGSSLVQCTHCSRYLFAETAMNPDGSVVVV
ncbi:MAG: hypothetical protein EXR79_03535 [Myxococcales bacterium]|nr:hypothetical protein [Myxococcales bacterium]